MDGDLYTRSIGLFAISQLSFWPNCILLRHTNTLLLILNASQKKCEAKVARVHVCRLIKKTKMPRANVNSRLYGWQVCGTWLTASSVQNNITAVNNADAVPTRTTGRHCWFVALFSVAICVKAREKLPINFCCVAWTFVKDTFYLFTWCSMWWSVLSRVLSQSCHLGGGGGHSFTFTASWRDCRRVLTASCSSSVRALSCFTCWLHPLVASTSPNCASHSARASRSPWRPRHSLSNTYHPQKRKLHERMGGDFSGCQMALIKGRWTLFKLTFSKKWESGTPISCTYVCCLFWQSD